MNRQPDRYDKSLYNRDPYVYIGFNLTKDEHESKQSVVKIANEIKKKNEIDVSDDKNTLIARKSRRSEKEFLTGSVGSNLEEDIPKQKSNITRTIKEPQLKDEINLDSGLNRKMSSQKKVISNKIASDKSTKQIEAGKKSEINLYDKIAENNKVIKKTEKNISNNSHTAKEINKINSSLNNPNSKNRSSNKMLLDNIFDSGLDIDIRPKKKEQALQKQAIEVISIMY